MITTIKDSLSLLGQREVTQAISLAASVAALGWIGGGVLWLGADTANPVAALNDFSPFEVYSEWFSLAGIDRPDWLVQGARWLRSHPEFATVLAAIAGLAIHGSSIPNRISRFSASVAWVGLIASVEALGFGRASLIALISFGSLIVLVVVAVLIPTGDRAIDEWEISWHSIRHKFMVNFLNFFLLPLLPLLLLGWVIRAYGYEGLKRGEGSYSGDRDDEAREDLEDRPRINRGV